MWQLPITLPDGTPLFFNPNFPFQDLNKLNPTDFKRNLLSSVSPFIKVPMELMTGYEFFRERPIERYPGYKAPVPGILQNIVSALPKSMINKLNIEKDNRGRYVMAPKLAHAIASLVPFVRNTSRMMMQEPVAIPADRYFQWVSYMFGAKIKPLDTLTQQYYHTLDEIKKRKQRMKEYGIQ